MSNDYTPEVGDRVRVVLEGEVTANRGGYLCIGGNSIKPNDAYVVSVEKIEPPVEVFGPGDVVRAKRSGSLYAVALGGYLDLSGGHWVTLIKRFTSAHYERVDLS